MFNDSIEKDTINNADSSKGKNWYRFGTYIFFQLLHLFIFLHYEIEYLLLGVYLVWSWTNQFLLEMDVCVSLSILWYLTYKYLMKCLARVGTIYLLLSGNTALCRNVAITHKLNLSLRFIYSYLSFNPTLLIFRKKIPISLSIYLYIYLLNFKMLYTHIFVYVLMNT